MESLVQEIVKKIKEKKDLSGLSEKFISDFLLEKYSLILKKQSLSEKDKKFLVKQAREKLRRKSGMFHTSSRDSEDFSEVIKNHSSTRERLDFYPELKKIISTLKVKSILDLGAGLNPLALATSKIKYYATEINDSEINLINEFFKKNKISGHAFYHDIRSELSDLPSADLCLIFKVLDIATESKKDKKILLDRLLSELNCKTFLISFPSVKISGKKMNSPRRFWFESLLSKKSLNFSKFQSKNEIFYLITKHQS